VVVVLVVVEVVVVLVVVEVVVVVLVAVVVDSRGLCGNNGFVQILESPEVYKSHFPGLEGPGIRPWSWKVIEM